MLAGIACLGAALMITPLSAAGTSKANLTRHAIKPVDPSRTKAERPQDTVDRPQDMPEPLQDKASGSEVAPEPDPLVGRTKFDWQDQSAASEEDSEAALAREKKARDKQRMTTHVGDARPVAFQDFYPFPVPAPAAEATVSSESGSRKSLYWIGATGAALVAGVAAYFIFSGTDEPERVHTVMAIE